MLVHMLQTTLTGLHSGPVRSNHNSGNETLQLLQLSFAFLATQEVLISTQSDWQNKNCVGIFVHFVHTVREVLTEK